MFALKLNGVHRNGIRDVAAMFKRWSTGTPSLYVDTAGPPGRFVIMTACYLQISIKLEHVDIFAGEQNTPTFYEINPLRKVPVLVHKGLTIRDSNSIALYLCEMSPGSLLFPLDAGSRAKILEMMFYNASILFPLDSTIMSELFRYPDRQVNKILIDTWVQSLDFVEYNLRNNCWLAGSDMGLSDLCCGATVSTVEYVVPMDRNRHPNVVDWLDRLKKHPVFEINREGMDRLKRKHRFLKYK